MRADWRARVNAGMARKRELTEQLRGTMVLLCELVEEGYRADMTATQLIRETGLARQTVYDMLNGMQKGADGEVQPPDVNVG